MFECVGVSQCVLKVCRSVQECVEVYVDMCRSVQECAEVYIDMCRTVWECAEVCKSLQDCV